MTIWKTAQFFYLIFVWKLILDTYRGPGCGQFMWSIFFNWRWLLERCDRELYRSPAVHGVAALDAGGLEGRLLQGVRQRVTGVAARGQSGE